MCAHEGSGTCSKLVQTRMAKIFVAEDDKGVIEVLGTALKLEGHQVEFQENGEDAAEYLKTYQYDVIILDWELPELSGLELCKLYRARGGQAPILFLTGRASLIEKETGFNSGADDYLTKPFQVRELIVRIRALLRRPLKIEAETLEFCYITMDPSARKVTIGENTIHLAPMEFIVLEFFLRNPEQVFSAEHLVERVWTSRSDRSPATLRSFMKRLRDKITPEGSQSLIRTIHGSGYILSSTEQ